MSISFYAEAVNGKWSDVVANMSNGNAASVIAALGIEFDYCGSIDPKDLIARADMYQAIGTPALYTRPTLDTHEGTDTIVGMRMVEFGIDEDYILRKFEDLREVAQDAIERGVQVVWA